MRSLLRFRYLWPLALLAGTVVGQTARIPVLPGSSVEATFLDIALGLTALAWLVRLVIQRRLTEFVRFVWRHPVWKWSVLFLGWAAVSLAINAPTYSASDVAVAGSYLLRLAAAVAVLWYASFERPPIRREVVIGTLVAGAILTGLGFLQILFVPDFRFMVAEGWDPHLGRLLSTFYDPNYFGVFLVLVMTLSLSDAFGQSGRRRVLSGLLFVAAWGALYLAFSRSAWVAGLIAVVGLSFKKDWRLALLLLVTFVGILFVPSRLGSRFEDTANLAKSENNASGTYQCDESASGAQCDNSGGARLQTLENGFELFTREPAVGVGFNAYGFGLQREGIIKELRRDAHSSQGSDSSVLNVAATTGVIGLGLFVIFFLQVLRALRQVARRTKRVDWIAYGLLWFTIAWLAASFLNNAVLYILLFVPWALLTGAVLATGRRP